MQFDWERIRELREEIGEEDYAEVLDLFFLEIEDAVTRLGQPGTMPERHADLHFIKGSALNLGFSGLAALCLAAERKASAGELADDELRAVIDACQQTRKTFAPPPVPTGASEA